MTLTDQMKRHQKQMVERAQNQLKILDAHIERNAESYLSTRDQLFAARESLIQLLRDMGVET